MTDRDLVVSVLFLFIDVTIAVAVEREIEGVEFLHDFTVVHSVQLHIGRAELNVHLTGDRAGCKYFTVLQVITLEVNDGRNALGLVLHQGRNVLVHQCARRIDDRRIVGAQAQRYDDTACVLDCICCIHVRGRQQCTGGIDKRHTHGRQQLQTLPLILSGLRIEDIAAAGTLCGAGAVVLQHVLHILVVRILQLVPNAVGTFVAGRLVFIDGLQLFLDR